MLTTSRSGRSNRTVVGRSWFAGISFKVEIVTITLNHFSAALVFSLFASIVFGITHRDNAREMVRYGLYCFAMFLGGVFVAGWLMWLLKR
jgi:hypothetical protein